METKVVKEEPLIILQGGNHWEFEWSDHTFVYTRVYAKDLISAAIGDEFVALDPTNTRRASENESIKVVFKDDRGVAAIHRSWGTTNDSEPTEWQSIELIWFELGE